MQLQGKVAVVTGGTGGIGRAIAESFLREGASVIVNGRNPEKGQKVLADFGAGNRARFEAGDATKKEDLERVVDSAVKHYGQLDILVNNAGGAQRLAPLVD